jgi:predicted Zn finger-like uncharacterized protein
MIIVCPNCSTRYEVAAQAIGDHGRSVQCANCTRSWHAKPVKEDDFSNLLLDELDNPSEVKSKSGGAKKGKKDGDKSTSPQDEDALDVAFNAEEDKQAAREKASKNESDDDDDDIFAAEGETFAAEGAPVDDERVVENAVGVARELINSINDDNEVELTSYAARRRQQIERMKRSRRIARRRKEIARALPMARLKRNISYGAIIATCLVIAGLFSFQNKIVEIYPDLAGFYRLFGQQVNVVGLNFADVKTNRMWRDGHEVLTVRTKIINETNRMISLTPIRVALIGENDQIIYEWSTTPDIAVLEGNGVFDFETELSSPPRDVRRVRLKFLEWQGRSTNVAPKKDYQDVKLSTEITKSKSKFTFGTTSVTQERIQGMAASKAGG